jgi:UV DNA damage endonuclease
MDKNKYNYYKSKYKNEKNKYNLSGGGKSYKFPKLRLGLCCSIMTLRYKNDVYSSRRKNLKTIIGNGQDHSGLDEAKNTAKENVIDLIKMMFWAKNHGIDVMRISSELVPHGNNVELVKHFGQAGEEYISLEFLRPYLRTVGRLAGLEGIRLTFHPGQFVQIGTPDKKVFEATVRELEMHTNFLDYMKAPKDSVIVVHIGGMYCDKGETIKRFIKQFKTLPESVKRRVVLENDEKCYDIDDVLRISEELNVPTVFDLFHYYCYKKYHPDKKQLTFDELIPRVLETWKKRDIRPKFHLSEQMQPVKVKGVVNKNAKPIGSHSLYIDEMPQVFLNLYDKYGVEADIMIEAKGKEVAISKLYKKYPDLKPEFRKELPKTLPKDALKDLKLPDEIKEEVRCECEE